MKTTLHFIDQNQIKYIINFDEPEIIIVPDEGSGQILRVGNSFKSFLEFLENNDHIGSFNDDIRTFLIKVLRSRLFV